MTHARVGLDLHGGVLLIYEGTVRIPKKRRGERWTDLRAGRPRFRGSS